MAINIIENHFWLLRVTWPLYKDLFIQWFLVLATVSFAWMLPRVSRCESAEQPLLHGKSVFWAAVASAGLTVVASTLFILYRVHWNFSPNGIGLLRFALHPTNFRTLSVIWEFGIGAFALLIFITSGLTWSAIGFRHPDVSVTKATLTLFVAAAAVILVTALHNTYFAPESANAKPGPFGPLGGPHSVHAILISSGIAFKTWIVVFPAMVEEPLFRGMLFQYLRKYLSGWLALIIQSLAFAAVHVEPRQFVWLFIVGIIFGAAFWRTKSLYIPIVLHSLVNFLAIA